MSTKWIATIVSKWLCPEVHRNAERYAERYDKLWRGLDEARWWLGVLHPEAASLAQRLIDEDQFYWTSQKPMRRPEWTWQAPEWIHGIAEYRRWLDTKPFTPSPALRSGGDQ